jgi:hypothetical protein
MKQRPVAIGLLLCEQVIVEETTRNLTPVNCFTQRIGEQVPTDPFSFVLFANLTDGSGDIVLDIVIERLDTFGEIYRRSLTHRFRDPLREVSFVFRIRNCTFPVFGHYQVSLWADGEPVAQRKLRIVQRSNPS